jgi:hypothetical protein
MDGYASSSNAQSVSLYLKAQRETNSPLKVISERAFDFANGHVSKWPGGVANTVDFDSSPDQAKFPLEILSGGLIQFAGPNGNRQSDSVHPAKMWITGRRVFTGPIPQTPYNPRAGFKRPVLEDCKGS